MKSSVCLAALVSLLSLSACATGGAYVAPGSSSGLALAGPREEVERIAARQVTLSRARFSPGEIDGRNAVLTRRAAARWVAAHPGQEDVPPAADAFTTYTVRSEDLRFVGPLPPAKEEQAKLPFLTYERSLEMVAEKFRASPELVAFLNNLPTTADVKAGDLLRVPNVPPLRIEAVREDARPVAGGSAANSVRIRPAEGTLEIFSRDGARLGVFPVSCGSARTPTPKGEWTMVSKVPLPPFRWDEEMLNHGRRSKEAWNFPPGPNNPVGVYWAGLSKPGVGIHGNPLPGTVFEGRSHSCIRMTNWDVLELARLTAVGSKVVIE